MLRLRSYTGRTRILWFEIALSQSPSFPVPLDQGNEDSGDEIGPNRKTAAHAFVTAMLRLGLQAPLVARNYIIFFLYFIYYIIFIFFSTFSDTHAYCRQGEVVHHSAVTFPSVPKTIQAVYTRSP